MTIAAVFLASLSGSLHCLGMCGGFTVSINSLSPDSHLPQALYHLGRLFTYILLGLIGGLVGDQLDQSRWLGPWHLTASVLMGLLLFGLGIRSFFSAKGVSGFSLPTPIKKIWKGATRSGRHLGPLVMGMFSGFLPCGWLYSFVVVAVAVADPIYGMATMATFWLGTLPVLIGLGSTWQMVIQKWKWKQHLVVGSLMMLGGGVSIASHWLPQLASPFIVDKESGHQCSH